jgi:hypothetical protein
VDWVSHVTLLFCALWWYSLSSGSNTAPIGLKFCVLVAIVVSNKFAYLHLPEMMWLLWYFSALFLYFDGRIIVWTITSPKHMAPV